MFQQAEINYLMTEVYCMLIMGRINPELQSPMYGKIFPLDKDQRPECKRLMEDNIIYTGSFIPSQFEKDKALCRCYNDTGNTKQFPDKAQWDAIYEQAIAENEDISYTHDFIEWAKSKSDL